MQHVLSWENSFISLHVASGKSKEWELSGRGGASTNRRQMQSTEEIKKERTIP